MFRNLSSRRRLQGMPGPGGTGQRRTMTETQDGRAARGRATGMTEPARAMPVGAVQRLDSRALFHAAREIIIEHDGADYRLRLTANGKLILTK